MSDKPLDGLPTDAIAIVGMAGRFPGASSVAELWDLVRDGRRGIRTLDEGELRAAGVSPTQLADPRYVRARGALEGIDGFDAELFGMSPREAAFTDPQQRLFLECAFEAFEDAAIDPSRSDELRIGVFGGVSSSSYFLHQVLAGTDPLGAGADVIDRLRLGSLGSDKDFFTTRVSYRLDLRGPSVDVQSACSTSAVAVHLAAQSLQMQGCDVALAGGASVFVPHLSGYLAQAGGVLARDGHCRVFDASASGTVPGSGAGVVVLRRLEDALADGDPIRAVLIGSAINNDGGLKAGYGAPSIDGQADAIAEALTVAGVPASSIDYVEAHGTGTPIGDPIEVKALRIAFGAASPAEDAGAKAPVALGAIKANIGHLDAAAGIAGLIKAVLALEHRTLPPQPEFTTLNPKIDLGDDFVVPREAASWPASATPRRAGVSSFGIGGTNAHLVLQEAPPIASDRAVEPPVPKLLIFSARSAGALAARGTALASALEERPELPVADLANTLVRGRREMPMRQAVVASTTQQAAAQLRAPGALASAQPIQRVVFLLPGQGAQRLGMARGLLTRDPALRKHLASMCDRLAPSLGFDPWQLYANDGPGPATHQIDETHVAQPLLFAIEVALGQRWLELGVEPAALLGHSLGELSAACLAGVFSEADGLDLVVARGAILRDQPRGSMIAVRADADELAERLAAGPTGVVVAARNGPAATTLSGPTTAIDEVTQQLTAAGFAVRPLATSHAFHSPLMDGAVERFVQRVAGIELHAPRRTVLSNRTGAPLTAAEATDPGYWGRQLRDPVLFADGLASLEADAETAFVEVGPPGTLTPLVRTIAPNSPRLSCLAEPSDRGGDPDHADVRAWLATTGRLWAGGVPVATDPFGTPSAARRRIGGLPSYPFQRQRHWVERPTGTAAPAHQRSETPPVPEGRVWVPSWCRRPAVRAADARSVDGDWLIVADRAGLADPLEQGLADQGGRVTVAAAGDAAAIDRWLERLDPVAGPARVVHLGGVATAAEDPPDALDFAREGFATVAELAAALARAEPKPVHGVHEVIAVTSGLAEVQHDDRVDPGRATVLGAVRVAAQELAGVRVRAIDVDSNPAAALVPQLLLELSIDDDVDLVALRGAHRWVEHLESIDLPAPRQELDRGSLVVITGGLGRMGRKLARWLVTDRAARVVLLGRTVPDSVADDPELAALANSGSGAALELECVDVTDVDALTRCLDGIAARLGPIHAVLHLANAPARTPLERTDRDALLAPLAAKVTGTLALEQALQGHNPQWVMLSSSLAALLGGPGTASYTAANAFLDAFASARRGPWRSVGWDVWSDGRGIAGLDVDVAVATLERLIAAPDLHHVYVSTRDLAQRRDEVAARLRAGAVAPRVPNPNGPNLNGPNPNGPNPNGPNPNGPNPNGEEANGAETARAPRPALATPYVAPRNEIEASLAAIWAEVLGLEAVGVDDPFFDLGGDSLLATMLLSKVSSRFALEIPVGRFFEAPTVAQAAAVLADELERNASQDDLDELLAEIESLSEEEASRLLEEGAP
ncbi:MAG: SDR family NAD(P)-dependent oxidoreductase [Planctomycetota bacterium]